MKSIRLISTSTIRPTNVSEANHVRNALISHRIELTPSDLILIKRNYTQRGLLFHKKPQPLSSWLQHLKTTLSKTLDIFYPLAGRLVMIENDDVDSTKSFYVDCNGAGALFIHAAFDGPPVSVSDVLDPVHIPEDIVDSFFPMNGVLNYEGVSEPLLVAQVTELDDGVFVALTTNHSVMDGTSFWRFFNTWSQISRDGVVSDPPHLVFDRDQFMADMNIDLPLRIPFDLDKTKIPSHIVPTSLQRRMFHFSKETIAKLKAKANAETGYSTKISSLQALMAHLWVSITRNRRLKPDEEVSCIMMVGIRQRTEPPLGEGYFGNAFSYGGVETTVGKLLENGFGWAAWQINMMVASQTKEKIREFLKNLAKNAKPSESSTKETNRRLVIGSSPRFNVYGNEFGWGKPVAVRRGPSNKSDGNLSSCPGAEEGSIDFEVCLKSDTFYSMDCDEDFLETLG
ncbi:Transferase [Trema orientale]|uniref:Transferase n=1 Tax=Trema orientale TaxID=63057 RepID=A0A2P5DPR9_TREOI|nr:Transferase [Trema orientale]